MSSLVKETMDKVVGVWFVPAIIGIAAAGIVSLLAAGATIGIALMIMSLLLGALLYAYAKDCV